MRLGIRPAEDDAAPLLDTFFFFESKLLATIDRLAVDAGTCANGRRLALIISP
jgi:hypothetical protein